MPNLSAWALEHKSIVLYLIIVFMVAGLLAYLRLGRAEDPDFTFKVMVVRTLWPGATTREVEQQLTEKIEKKLQETVWLDTLNSASKPGESLTMVLLRDDTPKSEVPEAWRQVRRKIEDISQQLPEGVQGPFINDEFGDVDVVIYALTGDGFTLPELRREADRIARELKRVHGVKKIEMVGVQDEKIYVDLAPARMAALGLTPSDVSAALKRQNSVAPAGFIETDRERVRVQVTGPFDSVAQIADAQLSVGRRTLRLGDIATISRGVADPPSPRMRAAGRDAIGIGVVMEKGGDVLKLGEDLRAEMARLKQALPAGIEVHTVADQPEVVHMSIDLFVESLAEAVAIVLAVSFLTLGWRTGTVVALSIPLVLAITFLLMRSFNIDLQRVSLGALVIALGLLVDDAIIAVEMMVVKMEQGWDRFKAATYAYTSTAFPMLTGTLITAAGFLPVGFAKSAAGEYTFSIFAVVTIALFVSWLVAVVFTPYIGYQLLDPVALAAKGAEHGGDIYDSPFYRRFRKLVEWCLRHRWRVIALTVAAFVVSLVLFGTVVKKQFFPSSSRPEILIELWLPQGASLKATAADVTRVEALLKDDATVDTYSSYIGNSPPRFYLPLSQQLFADNFAELIVVTKGLKEREDLLHRLEERFADGNGEWSHLRLRVLRLENGPPVNFPVSFRVMGEDVDVLRNAAEKVATVMRADPNLQNVQFDWNDKVNSLRVEIDQDRARALGVGSQDVALTLKAWLRGATITQYREADQLIDVVWRATAQSRDSFDALPDLDIVSASGRHLPLSQVARLVPVKEEGLIWRRDRLPTLSVRADLAGKTTGPAVSARVNPQLDDIRAELPPGYRIEMGGTIEESGKSERSIFAVMPFMVVVVLTLLMLQLQSFRRTVMVLLTAPLGLIGVTVSLLAFQVPFGFVAQLGVIALMGMILRNSVILVDQIEQDEMAGKSTWEAIVGSTVRRLRPIVLTAAAAVLAMIPLSFQVFWGPMAVAIMGGLIVATALTCLFLPALYAAWYRVPAPA
jgi:multidrug efflux pump